MNGKISSTNPSKDFKPNIFNFANNQINSKMELQNENKKTKILIIDDHRLFADGIKSLLKTYDQNIYTEFVSDVFSANEQINSINKPDLILLGINHAANEHSYKLIEQINQSDLNIPVMILSVTDSSSAAGQAIKNNASGFISKNCSRKTILEAVLTVLEGNIYIKKPKQEKREDNPESNADKITKRQKEVLSLLSEGLLNKQIANKLDISANTVKAHLSDLFRQLHVSNRTAAVQSGYKYGLIK